MVLVDYDIRQITKKDSGPKLGHGPQGLTPQPHTSQCKHLPTRHLHSKTGRSHEEIQESKVRFAVPGNFVLLCQPRDDHVVTV